MTESLGLLISEYPKMEERALEEEDNWSLDVCWDIQDLEERKAAFNHEGVFKDCEDFKDRQKDKSGIAKG